MTLYVALLFQILGSGSINFSGLVVVDTSDAQIAIVAPAIVADNEKTATSTTINPMGATSAQSVRGDGANVYGSTVEALSR